MLEGIHALNIHRSRTPRGLQTKKLFLPFLCILLVGSSPIREAVAWGNGGYSDDPSDPDYGTHDFIAEHALDWLPSNEKGYIEANLAIYLYGTELPDNNQAVDGIGDTTKHHVYFSSDGTLLDDSSAIRAAEEYNLTVSSLTTGDFMNASKHAGIMAHYLADLAVFGHVMGAATDWGSEEHHSDYEGYVGRRTEFYDDEFEAHLSFDGVLETYTACDAAVELAYDTTFHVGGDLTCTWMDDNYDWGDPVFRGRCVESLNLAVNYVADVLHTLYMSSAPQMGDLEIKTVDGSQNPISGATVTSTSQPSGQPTLSGATGPDGSVIFPDINAGSYTLQIDKGGYLTETTTASVTAGGTTEVTIILEEEPSNGGGIPGFPYESIIAGFAAATLALLFFRRKMT